MAQSDKESLLSAGKLLAFVLPCLPLAALGLPIIVFLPEFYARGVGLNLKVVGLAFMVIRLLDIGFDPLMGGIMDRLRRPLGGFRPWLILGAPVFMVGVWRVFLPPKGVGPAYLIGWLLVLYAGQSISILAHSAWASRLSTGYHDRSRVFGWWQTANIIGMLSVLAIPALTPALGLHLDTVGAMGLAILTIAPLAISAAVLFAGEPKTGATEPSGAVRLFDLIRRPAVARIVLADLCLGLAPGITGAIFIFFFRTVQGFTLGQANLLLIIYFLAGLVGAPIWMALARHLGKHRALVAANLYSALAFALIGFAPRIGFLPMCLAQAGAGLGYSASLFLLRALMGDAADEAEAQTGLADRALLYGLLASTSKVGYAFAVGLTFVSLGIAHFDPAAGVKTHAAAILALRLLYGGSAPLAYLIGTLALVGYHLSPARYSALFRSPEGGAPSQPQGAPTV